MFIHKYFSAKFSLCTHYLLKMEVVFLNIDNKMRKKTNVVSQICRQDFLENKENMAKTLVFKNKPKKYFSKCSKNPLKDTSTKFGRKPKKIERIEEEKDKPKWSDNTLINDSLELTKTRMNAEKMSEQQIPRNSTLNAKVELKKPVIPKFSNQSKCKPHDSPILKEAVVVLKRCDNIKKEITPSTSYDYSTLDNYEETEQFLNKPKSCLPMQEYHGSILMKDAVVILKRCDEDIKKNITSKSDDSSKIMLEDDGKIKKTPNKSGKGSKRKATEKNKSENEDSSKSKKQKVSGPSKSKKKEQIPDVSAIDFNNDCKSPCGNLWNFKISSWNVNGIRAWLEKNGVSYLHHEQPDILCIQETKCSDDKLPAEMKTVEGYHAYWLAGDKDGYSGVGLLSKEKPIKVEYGIGISEHDNEGRVITAEYDKFYLVSTYVPNAGRGLVRLDYRMKWDKDFREYLKKLDATKPVILCGDLNVAHEEIDLANPKGNKKNAGFTKEEREGFSDLLKEDFIDTFRHLYPHVKGAYTFWTYMMNARAKDVGWRLDYFVMSERFTENLCDNVIRKDVFGSDHCPITLFLSL